ncbi:hypothetical protein HCN44_005886 [Aphidius gifuensis]|uniref:Small ribosomal subunit protein uS7 domain-containing protein n=1 Tax=Aphidius gifuensis TaxID=684658 RepID=A0A834XTC2_APHGI|nr:28S ribosomal protein S7, mitochondrial [Aphidius gifuensis]KAF7993105.1 hypothetical protein HCN44_005886 [Aphidius gifuensis]
MATLGSQIGKLQFLSKYICSQSGSRLYSVFPPTYIKPIFRKDEQAILEQTGEAEKIAHVPIKPAMGAETSSEFYDPIVAKFTNYVLRKGKKRLARSLVSDTFENIKRIQLKRYHKASPEHRDQIILDPAKILHKAVVNCTPVMQLEKMRRAGTAYPVPVPVLENRQRFLAMNWLIQAGQNKEGEVPFSTKLANELIDASNNHGSVVKKKQDLHKQCEANRSYAHYRWS